MFNQQPERSNSRTPKVDLASALRRDADKLSDEADQLRQQEIDRIYDLLTQDPERWDGLS